VVGVSGDLIERYLAELRARLHTPDAVLVLAEAEDHLRETVARKEMPSATRRA
jgi:hypothetical protein